MTIEYRVKPVTRYIVTRHETTPTGQPLTEGGVNAVTRQIGSEYPNADIAYEVGYAVARHEAEALGYGPDDMRLIYPRHPDEQDLKRVLGA